MDFDIPTQLYTPASRIQGRFVTLPKDEAHHAMRVLRVQPGEEIGVVDGEGGWYRVEVQQVGEDTVTGQIVDRKEDVGEPGYNLCLAVGLLKRRKRWETFLEKAVEVGVSRVVPLISERTEKESVRSDRARRVMIAAMKQCGRSRLPHLDEPRRFDDELSNAEHGLALCCHQGDDETPTLASYLTNRFRRRIRILVGSEGGFTSEEVERAHERGWDIVTLGKRRLRTETAGIVSAAVVDAVSGIGGN